MRTDCATRRSLLGALAGGAGALAGCLGAGGDGGTDGSSSGGGAASYGGFLDGVSNVDGVVDRTGDEAVTVEVGVTQGGGPFGFGPAAVRVSPGTTVTWRWVDGRNSHNVKATGGSFEFRSGYAREVGHTFERTFERSGVAKYVCVPHESLGMKGVVAVAEG